MCFLKRKRTSFYTFAIIVWLTKRFAESPFAAYLRRNYWEKRDKKIFFRHFLAFDKIRWNLLYECSKTCECNISFGLDLFIIIAE